MISLTPLGGRKWEVNQEYTTEVFGKTVVIPKGFISDLATIPFFLWPFLPPYGRYTEGAVVHDYIYLRVDFSRKECDDIFLEVMRRCRTSEFTAQVIYRTVRAVGWIHY